MNYASLALTILMSTVTSLGPNKEKISLRTPSLKVDSLFSLIANTEENRIFMNNNDGYTKFEYKIYKAPFTNKSDLYIVRAIVQITPGRIAKVENPSGGYNDVRLGRGMVSIELQKYFEYEEEYGANIRAITYWPQSTPVNVSLSSGYSGTYSTSYTSSFEAGLGVSMGDGLGASINGSSSETMSTAYTFSTSNTISYQEPLISAQYSSGINKKAYWTYEYIKGENHGLVTLPLDLCIMFEMDREERHCPRDSFQFFLHIETEDLYYEGNFFMGRGWKYGTKYENTLQVNAFYDEKVLPIF